MVVRAATGAAGGGGGGGLLPNLPNASSVAGTDLFAVYQSTILNQATALQIAQYVASVIAGIQISYATPAGASNDTVPTGFTSSVNRLDVDTSAGAANWTGLTAGVDNQMVYIRVTGANNLTLNNQNTGSLAANRFAGVDDFPLLPGAGLMVCYYAGTVNRWVMMP